MATLRSEEDARKWAHKHQKASQAKEAIEEQIHTCRAESFPWNREDKEYPNAIYVGRADIFGDQKRFAYYIGQSKRPLKRWKSHVASGTGCTQFSDDTDPEWAILAWDIPTASMDVAESYLIGYFLAMFGCVNGNRGKSEYAFRRGYLDGVHRKQPAVCARISLDELNWCDVVYEYAGNEGVAEVFHPAGDNKLLDQRWGFHLVEHDLDAVLKSKEAVLKIEASDLRRTERDLTLESRRLESLASSRVMLAFFAGFAVATAFWLLTISVKRETDERLRDRSKKSGEVGQPYSVSDTNSSIRSRNVKSPFIDRFDVVILVTIWRFPLLATAMSLIHTRPKLFTDEFKILVVHGRLRSRSACIRSDRAATSLSASAICQQIFSC